MILHESKKIQLNEGMKELLHKDRESVTDEIWLIVGKYAPNNKNKFDNFIEWIPEDSEKVKNFVKLMAYNELKKNEKAWNKVYNLFTEFDALTSGIDTGIIVNSIFHDFNNNQFSALLNEYHFNKQEHKNILRSYCSYLGMKKGKDITDSLLKKRSQYVYSYLSLYPKIESGNEEYEIGRIHWGDVKKTYEHEIGSNLEN